MKVVLFCGGFGMRIREYSEDVPKPMVPIGHRPVLWHVMKYYAHYGHKHFILCLGHQAHAVKQYFLNYDECVSNDFTLAEGGKRVTLAKRDIEDWTITFVDTGLSSNIGQRLMAVRDHLNGDELFLANYSDGLTDFPMPRLIERVQSEKRVAGFLCVHPSFSFHFVDAADSGDVHAIRTTQQSNLWINAGYFVFRREIFDYMRPGEELVVEPFQRLLAERQLLAHRYDGFFQAMDTFKERQQLDQLYVGSGGRAPWMPWANGTHAGNGR